MRKPDFRFPAFCRNVKNDLRTNPFGFVARKAELSLHDTPNNLFTRTESGDLLLAAVCPRHLVGEFCAQPVRVAGNLPGPPTGNMIDGMEYFGGRFVHQKVVV